MMILSKNKGISNYYEVCDIELTGSYEEKMLINNHMKYLPDAEVRTLDNRRSMYVKVDGYSPLTNVYGKYIPSMKDILALVKDIKNCIKEVQEYLLSPSGLVLNMKYILYDEQSDMHKFIYTPNTVRDFRDQLKQLFEEIMRIFDHKNRDGVVFLYEMYSRFLGDNFTPEIFCRIVDEFEGKYGDDMHQEIRDSGVSSVSYQKQKMDFFEDTDYSADDEGVISESAKSLYILAAVAAVITSVVLLVIFGPKSIKFSALIMVSLVIYIASDIMHQKKKTECMVEVTDENVRPVEESSYEPLSLGRIESSAYVRSEEESESKDTTVLSQEAEDGVSRLIPLGEQSEELIYLIEGETRIGRQTTSCDYCINEPSISRVHAILEKIGSTLLVRDAGSTNGTYVNEKRLEENHPVEAVPGDLISFAGIQYECR